MSKVRRTRLWRWRSNPLRRHADVVEAWIVLASWTGFALGGAVVGTVTARAADESLSQARAERHSVEAVLVESTASSVTDAGGASDSAVWAKVRWTGSDRSVHTGRTMVDAGRKAGSTVLVWTDRKGDLTKDPATATEAAAEAGSKSSTSRGRPSPHGSPWPGSARVSESPPAPALSGPWTETLNACTRTATWLQGSPSHDPLRRRENDRTTREHHRARQPQTLKTSSGARSIPPPSIRGREISSGPVSGTGRDRWFTADHCVRQRL